MKTLKEIKATNKDGKYYAVSSFTALYEAFYDASIGVMFYCMPDDVQIIGYIER